MVSMCAIRGHRHRKRRIRKVRDMREWTVSSVAVSSRHMKVLTSLETFYFELYVEPPPVWQAPTPFPMAEGLADLYHHN